MTSSWFVTLSKSHWRFSGDTPVVDLRRNLAETESSETALETVIYLDHIDRFTMIFEIIN